MKTQNYTIDFQYPKRNLCRIIYLTCFFLQFQTLLIHFNTMKQLAKVAITSLIAISTNPIVAQNPQTKIENFKVTDMHEDGNYKGRQSYRSSLEVKCGWQKWHRCWTISNGWIDFGDDHVDPIQVGNPTVEQGPGGIDEEGYNYDSYIITPN